MGLVKLDRIIKEINRYFNNGYQYVFWYDPDKEFYDEVFDSEGELAKKLEEPILKMGVGEQFKTKRKLLNESDQPYLIYAPIKRPPLEHNFLADMEHYSRFFSAKLDEIVFQQFQETLNFKKIHRQFIRQFIKYFQAKDRRESYIRYYDANRMNDHPEWGILTAIVKVEQFDENKLLIKVLAEGDQTDNKYLKEFKKYGVLDTFWNLYNDYFGTSQDVRSLDTLIKGAFITAIFSQLHGEVPDNLKKYNFNNAPNSVVFSNRFHDSLQSQKLYEQVSQKVWDECDLASYLKHKNLSLLVKITFFKQVNILILNDLLKKFENDGSIVDAETNSEIIDMALKQAPFEFKAEYQFLNYAQKILQYKPHYYDNWQAMLISYVKNDYQIDLQYRKFVMSFQEIPVLRKKFYQDLKRLVDQYYNDEILNNSIREWNQTFELEKVPLKQRQVEFYRQYVSYIRERVVVIISDAFRFEAAKELERDLTNDDRITVNMNYMLTGLPSITKIGMPVLLPHNDLQWDGNNVLVNHKAVDNANKRRALLQSYDDKNDLLELKDILNASSKEIRQMITGKKVIYVYHNHVDAIGDNLKTENDTFKSTEESIQELREAIQVLRTNNIAHIMVTADHGYIYREETVKEQDKIDVPTQSYDGKISHRYLITKDQLDIPGTKQVKLGCSLKNDDPTNVYYPTTVNVFKASGGKNYVHGGSSVQEMLIPVLDMKLTSAKSQAKRATLQLATTNYMITGLNMSLSFYQNKPISDLIKSQTYQIYFKDNQGRIISNVATVIADRNEDTYTEPIRINLIIQNMDYDRNQDYYLVIQPEDGNGQPQIIDYTMGIIG